MSWLARNARPIALIDGALLMGGVLLTAFNLLLIGWSVFIVALLLTIVAFLAIAAARRGRMDGWAWTAVLVVICGLLLALPGAVTIWQSYLTRPDHAEMLLVSQTNSLGLIADLVLWTGLAFFGLAARGVRALPSGVGWIFVAAAVVGLLGDLLHAWPFSPLWWVPAMLIVSFGLVAAVGDTAPEPIAVTGEPQAT